MAITATLAFQAATAAGANLPKGTFDIALLKESESTYREFKAEPPVEADQAVVIVLEQKLEDFLKLAARHNGYSLRFSSPLSGTLKNASLPINLGKLMPRLANRFDLDWYMNGKELYVSRASNRETRELLLKDIELQSLRDSLRKSGIDAGKYTLTIDEEKAIARLVGSPSHLDAITVIADELRK